MSRRQTLQRLANLPLETKLFMAADKLRNNMDAAEYKHVVLGLIFLKYISDSFEDKHGVLSNEVDAGADPEDPDEYKADNIFWVPREARWQDLKERARQPEIGKYIDDAMLAIERDNPKLKSVLPKSYARPGLDKQRLGELVDLITTIGLNDSKHKSQDILGRVYEYFLSQFAAAEGKRGGQFYTPRCIVNLLVEMIRPFKGRVYDPCCGSGGMFVQSERFVEAHGGSIGDISIYGQESNPTTRRLALMNFAIRRIEADLGREPADTFRRDLHPDLKADFILANPPFNDSEWWHPALREDIRWKYGLPPDREANFAWIQHIIHRLAPTGKAGFLMANNSLSATRWGQGDIRKRIVEADLVEAIVILPMQLFFSTGIACCIWVVSKRKPSHRESRILFIDAISQRRVVGRGHSELRDEAILQIGMVFNKWREESLTEEELREIYPYCKDVSLDRVRAEDYDLNPRRYFSPSDFEKASNPDYSPTLSDLRTHYLNQSQEAQVIDEYICTLLEAMPND